MGSISCCAGRYQRAKVFEQRVDLAGLSCRRAFEDHVLQEMGNSVFIRSLRAGTSSNPEVDCNEWRAVPLFHDHTQAVV
jgi:hypothetical protein